MQKGNSQTIDSHIQMPKAVLRRFTDKGLLFLYDFSDGRIKKCGPKSVNVQEGYYSNRTEEYLNRTIEDPLGDLICLIEKPDFSEKPFVPKDHMEESIVKYLQALICRGKLLIKKATNLNPELCHLDEQKLHDTVVKRGLWLANANNLFSEYRVTFLENRTSIPFVLPLGGHYAPLSDNGRIIIVPVTPKYAIYFMTKDIAEKYIDGNIMKRLYIDDHETTWSLNRLAFIYEKDQNGQGVVSSSKKLLIDLAKSLQLPCNDKVGFAKKSDDKALTDVESFLSEYEEDYRRMASEDEDKTD